MDCGGSKTLFDKRFGLLLAEDALGQRPYVVMRPWVGLLASQIS